MMLGWTFTVKRSLTTLLLVSSNNQQHSTRLSRRVSSQLYSPVALSMASEKAKVENANDNDTINDTSLLLQSWISHDSLSFHEFSTQEATEIRSKLLKWYDQHRRKLPWRGDPPPWEGSTSNFGKKPAQETTTTGKKKQGNIRDFFASKTKEKKVPNKVKKQEQDNKTFPVTAYGVWVSEIMLQQTRVEAVVPYWVRWMNNFPTVQDLAAASDEEVNALWAGLGFYRRARLLHQAAKMVVDERNGQMPETVPELLKLPGIGRYTASAIASIAFDVTVPVVDGNVCRVLARLKAIANHVKSPALKDKYGWELAHKLVEAGGGSRAGDVNQALMELGATYCAPSGTGVDPNDPLVDYYYSTRLGKYLNQNQARGESSLYASQKTETQCPVCTQTGVEDALQTMDQLLQQDCPKDQSIADFVGGVGHKAFPLPPPKKQKREEVHSVAVLSCLCSRTNETIWLLSRRPENGLLAGQWEFPSSLLWSSTQNENKKERKSKTKKESGAVVEIPVISTRIRKRTLDDHLSVFSSVTVALADCKRQSLKEAIEHIFSHVRHTMWIEHANVASQSFQSSEEVETSCGVSARWMSESDMKKVGVTSGVKKILAVVQKDKADESSKASSKRQRRS